MLGVLGFLLGLAALIAGAELLVRGAGELAGRLRLAPLLVGLTVVALGTSVPELAITLWAAFTDEAADVALGNVVGSNIANVGLILGGAALAAPLVAGSALLRAHVPAMIAASLLTALLAADGRLSGVDGAVLLAGLGGYLALLVARRRGPGEQEAPPAPAASAPFAALRALLGVPLLAGGAWLVVEAAVALAVALGVSDLIIALTLVALGTSLPELAAALSALRRREGDLIIGNVVGSNIINLLAVLGLAAVLAPDGVAVASSALRFDIPVMVALALACLPVLLSGRRISRWEGGVLVAYYAAYCAYLYLGAAQHAALGPFSAVMLGFVVPLTVLVLVTGAVRELRRPAGRR